MCLHALPRLHTEQVYWEPVVEKPTRDTKQRFPRFPKGVHDTLKTLSERWPFSPSFCSSRPKENMMHGGSTANALLESPLQKAGALTVFGEQKIVCGVPLEYEGMHARAVELKLLAVRTVEHEIHVLVSRR